MSYKDTTVYMIGNAHIDPVWHWRWQEGLAEVLATCRSALDRMREYRDFVFTRADAATYAWIEDACPEMLEEIRARVAEGRWSIVGGWWEQADCNIPCGESFVRHLLHGKRWLMDRFGVDVKIGYNVDSFGHNAGLPQILAKAGVDHYVFMRPEPHEKQLPDSVFHWQGPDGSRVLCFRLHGPYATNVRELPAHVEESIRNGPKGVGAAACFYGVGNHGGGPTIESIETIRRMQADPEAPNPVFGTLEQFFEHVTRERADWPVVEGDLQHHAVGCYTAHSGIKALNRKAENALISAERFCVVAKLAAGRAFPKDALSLAWRKLLFSQFHDILAGTSSAAAYEDARDWLGSTIETAEHETGMALQSIACNIDTSRDGDAFVVFNPHAQAADCTVCFQENCAAIRDSAGRSVPVQTAARFFENTGRRQWKVFTDRLPPLGYRVYYSGDWKQPASPNPLEADAAGIASERYRVALDRVTGEIAQITDRLAGVDLLAAPAGAVVLEDRSDTWSHGVVAFDQVAGRFGWAGIELVESGPVRATLRIESRFGESTLWQDISLYADLPFLEARVMVDWREKHRMLKLEFPLALAEPVVTADAAHAVVSYPSDGAENPCGKWVDVTGKLGGRDYGVSLLNDGKHGFDVEGSTMRLSILRSPIYEFHEPRAVEPGKRYEYMDQGLHCFTFRLLPHAGSWQDAGTVREALLLNMPPVVVETHNHAGELPPEGSFGSVSEPNIDLAALKECEDDDSLIARLYETSGRATSAVLELSGAGFAVGMGPHELKTLKIRAGRAIEVDLTERET